MNAFINRAAASRKRLELVKEKGLRRYLSEHGAIDLASIMVGVIIIGIIGAVIAASVFTIIPWSQDKAASQNLDAVKTAESVTFAKSSDNGNGKYLPGTAAAGTDSLESVKLLKPSDTVAVTTLNGGADWVAVSVSPATGHLYAVKGSDGAIVKYDADGKSLSDNLTKVGTDLGVTATWASNKLTVTAP